MKTLRVACGMVLAVGGVASLRAQPEKTLREAVDRLWEAGNYSWEEKRDIDWGAARPVRRLEPILGSGETLIDGFTVAEIQKRHVVLFGPEAAFELKSGWRYAKDLTDEETVELGTLRGGFARADERARNYTHLVPHEILKLVLPMAANIQGTSAITADLVGTPIELGVLESHISSGLPLSVSARRGIFDPPLPMPNPRGLTATLAVEIRGGIIDVFSVQFTSTGTIAVDGGPPEKHRATREYRFELTKIGKTKVEVDSEARALFLSAPNAP